MKKKEKIKLIMLVLVLPITLLSIISTYAVTGLLSSEVSYDRSTSKLRSNNVQDAIDELNNKYKNTEDLKCPIGKKCSKYPASVTFDANDGKFDNNKSENNFYYKISTKISKTSNVDDEGNQTTTMPEASSGITDTVTIEGAESLFVEITYQTYSSSYSWVTVSDSTVEPTTSNYSSSISGKLYGKTKTTKTYTVTGDTVKFFFYNKGTSSTYNNYLGYYAKVKKIEKASGTYKEPTSSDEDYVFRGWNTKEDGSGASYSFNELNDYIYANIDENTNLKLYARYGDYVCKRASTLHTTICDNSNTSFKIGCQYEGNNNGDTITYGQLGTSGTLASGDAFDCDVNGDGTYDSATERFYYVSDYYDTSSKKFNSDVATLIYYTNVNYGNASYGAAYYGTDSSDSYNDRGPQKTSGKAYDNLPSTSDWPNIYLYKNTRAILNEKGGNTTSDGTLPSAYDYGDKAARFLTAQEINSACNITVGSGTNHELSNCKFLLENTSSYASNKGKDYWLETPESLVGVFYVYGWVSKVDGAAAYSSNQGTRPVIEIPKSQIEY